jgi:hypothetical protein
LLGCKLPFYSIEVALPLEFAVDPDSEEPGLLDWCYSLVVEVDRCRWCSAGAGKVEELALFRGKLHSPCPGPPVTRLPRAFEVAAGLLGIFTKGKEVKVVRKSHGYKAGVFLELCIQASGIEEEEYRGEGRALRHPRGDAVRRCRFPVKGEASCAVSEEAADPPDSPQGETLVLEGVQEACVIYSVKGSFNVKLKQGRNGSVAPGSVCSIHN